MAISQIATSVTVLQSGVQKGHAAVSLTNFGTSAESVVAEGSTFEILGAQFLASGDTTPQGSTWTAVGTGNIAYIIAIPSGTAGSQVITLQYTDTAPAWRTDAQGWYASAASSTRYLGGVYKQSATAYEGAFLLDTRQHDNLSWKEIQIGEWDMDSDGSVTLALGVGAAQVRVVYVQIRSDSGGPTWYALNYDTGSGAAGYWEYSAVGIDLYRVAAGLFDNGSFDGTASTVASRGYVTVGYVGAVN